MELWYRNTLLWGQTNLTEDDPVSCDLNVWKNYWKETGVQGIIINCGGIVSYYCSKKEGQYRAKFLEGDYFDVWNRAAREAGLRVIARMDIQTTTGDLYEKHPEWYCVDRMGKPILSQGRYVACANGGYYHEFVPEVFREVIERFGPDGFADNSWAGLGSGTICYCERCKAEFRRRYGLELPEKTDWEDPVYRKWIRFGYETRMENWNYFNQVTLDASGGTCRWFGMICSDPFDTGGRFYDIKKILENTPFIFCDQQSRDRYSPFEQNSWNGSLLKMASSEETVVAESMAHYYKGLRTFRLSSGEKQETRKWMISGISGGISPWYHFVGGGVQDKRKLQISKDIFAWCRNHMTYLHNRRNLAVVGLVWNQESAIYYGRDKARERCRYPFLGFAMALSRAGIPFAPVHADDIKRYAGRFRALILPSVAILSPDQEDSIIACLERGTGLVMSGVTGTRDEDGEPLAEQGRLWTYLGLTREEGRGETADLPEENWMTHEAHNYIRLPALRHEIFDGFEDTSILPMGGVVHRVVSEGSLKQISSFIPSFPIYPPEHAWIREEQEDTGTIFAGITERGARIVYLAADVDRSYGQYRIPDHGRLLAGAVRYAAGNRFPVTVSGTGHIHCDAYIQGDSLIIHLVNLCGCDGPVGTVTENLPTGPVEVMVQGYETEERTTVGFVSEESISIQNEVSGFRMTIKLLEEHEMVVIPVRQI